MKIIKFKKSKSNIYELYLEDKSVVKLYDEVILKSNILFTKEVSLEELNRLIEDNSYYELYNAVLKYLKNKMRCEYEIRTKFKGYPSKDLTKIINILKDNNYINEDEYINAYVNDSVNLKNIGPNKIINELLNLKLEEPKVLEKVNSVSNDIWREKIERLSSKEIKSNRNNSAIFLKRKILNNLISKGFYKEDIMDYLESIDINISSDIYEKEYNKLKTKLSRKYSDDELEREIKKRLKAKGF